MLKLVANNDRRSRQSIAVTISVQLTLEQIGALEDALELACNSRIEDFERDRHDSDVEAMKRAILAARDVKRFNDATVHLSKVLRSSTGT